MTAREKFQHLLREFFQFDMADLDFGIYRIVNYKRQVIGRWISQAMPSAIVQELRQGVLAEPVNAQEVLEERRSPRRADRRTAQGRQRQPASCADHARPYNGEE